MPFQHDYADSTQVVLLGMESATDREGWQKARDEGFVIVTRDADFQELSLVWGHPPKVIWLKTPNQSRAGTPFSQGSFGHHPGVKRAYFATNFKQSGSVPN
jgi:hypothetical protein